MGLALLLAAVLFLLAHCGQRKTPSEDSSGQNQQSEQTLTGQVNSTKESGPEKDVSSAEEPADEFSREEFLELGPRGVWPLWESTTDTFPVEAEKAVATRRAPFPYLYRASGT